VKLTVERLPESQVLLDIAADETEFAQAMEKAYRKVSRNLAVPGFRKGKAPRQLIERMYGREMFVEEAHRGLMEELYRQALKVSDIRPVGEPEVELIAAEPLAFKVTIPVFPEVTLGDYQSIRVEPQDAALAERDVDTLLQQLQERSSPWVDVTEERKPKTGDQVTVDLNLIGEDGEPFQEPIEGAVFELGVSELFEPLRAAIEELSVGESTDVMIAFEEDDQSAAERLRGQAVTYHVTLTGIKEKELISVDQLAERVAPGSSADEYRSRIRKDLHRRKTNDTRTEVVGKIIEQVAGDSTMEIPGIMIDEAVENEIERLKQRLQYSRLTLEGYLRTRDLTEDELKEELRPTMAQRLRNTLALREVAKAEGIEVTDQDIEDEVNAITADSPDVDRSRRDYLSNEYLRGVLRDDLFDRRLSDRLIEIATEGRGATLNGFVEGAESEIETNGVEVSATEAELSPTGSSAPDGDECPPKFPIKGNESSKIYHVPGSRL